MAGEGEEVQGGGDQDVTTSANIAAEFEAFCTKVFDTPHDKVQFEATVAERLMFDTDPGTRGLIQSAVQTELFDKLFSRPVNGQFVRVSDVNYGSQAYMDALYGSFIAAFPKETMVNNFGVIPQLAKRLSTDSPSDVQKAISAFTTHADGNLVHSVIDACKFSSAREEKSKNLTRHNILQLNIEHISQGSLELSVPKILDSIQKIKLVAQDSRYNDIPWLGEIRQKIDSIIANSWYTELASLVTEYPSEFSAKPSIVQTKEARDKLIAIFKNNQETVKQFGDVVHDLAVLTTLSRVHKYLPELLSVPSGSVQEASGIAIHNARHTKAVHVRATAIGMKVEFPHEEVLPADVKGPLNDDENHGVRKAVLKEAAAKIQNEEMPISIEIDHDRPIIVISAPNGVGKTHGMEIIGSQILWSQLTGTVDGAEAVALEPIEPPSILVNTASTSSGVSTFEGEMYPLVRAIAASESNKSKITLVDEIGRGTDSRDAVAIALAAGVHTIQTNGFLVLSTHYGHDIVDLATKIGIRSKMRIFTVDPATHALIEVDDPVDSQGVEVWNSRAKKLDKVTRSVLSQHAAALRTASVTGVLPEMVPWQKVESVSSEALQFVDTNTLKDLGMGTESGSRDVFEALLSLLPTKSHGISDAFYRHLESSSSFDAAILQEDRSIIQGLLDAAQKSKVSISNVSNKISEISSLLDTWNSVSVSKDDSKRIREFVNETGRYQIGKRLEFYSSDKSFDLFLNSFGSLSRVRDLTSGDASAFSQLKEIFSRDSKLNDYYDQLNPHSLTDIYRDAFLNAQDKEFVSMEKSLYVAIHEALGSTYDWKPMHVEKASELFGIPANTEPNRLGQVLADKWKITNVEMSKKMLHWIVTADHSASSSDPIFSLIRSTPLRGIFELIDVAVENSNEVQNEHPRGFPESSANWKGYVTEKLAQGDFEPLFVLSRSVRLAKGLHEGSPQVGDLQRYIYSLDHLILVEFQEALQKRRKESIDNSLSVADYRTLIDKIGYAGVWSNAVDSLKMTIPEESKDGTYLVEEGIPLDVLSKKKVDEVIKQSFSVSPDTNAVAVNGSNGNGKTVLLKLMGVMPLTKELSGYVPAKRAVVPKYSYVRSMINAGRSTLEASSFQNEADRSIQFVKDFVASGSPSGGLYLLDEPNASTSGGDQIGVTLSVAGLLTAHGNIVAMTNHNTQMYPVMRLMNEFAPMNFQVFAYPFLQGSPFKMFEIPSDQAETIHSGGIDKAASMGLDPTVVDIAHYLRSLMN